MNETTRRVLLSCLVILVCNCVCLSLFVTAWALLWLGGG